MSDADDPRCPECGEPIGPTATYCMHCSADLSEERSASDADDDGYWDVAESDGDPSGGSSWFGGDEAGSDTGFAGKGRPPDGSALDADGEADSQLLDPDSLADNTLTAVVGAVAGFVVGLLGTFVLLVLTESAWALLAGVAIWLGVTAHLVRRRTVQAALARGCYAGALVLLATPLVMLTPSASAEGGSRVAGFVVFLLMAALPAGVLAVIGWFASRFVPEGSEGSVG